MRRSTATCWHSKDSPRASPAAHRHAATARSTYAPEGTAGNSRSATSTLPSSTARSRARGSRVRSMPTCSRRSRWCAATCARMTCGSPSTRATMAARSSPRGSSPRPVAARPRAAAASRSTGRRRSRSTRAREPSTPPASAGFPRARSTAPRRPAARSRRSQSRPTPPWRREAGSPAFPRRVGCRAGSRARRSLRWPPTCRSAQRHCVPMAAMAGPATGSRSRWHRSGWTSWRPSCRVRHVHSREQSTRARPSRPPIAASRSRSTRRVRSSPSVPTTPLPRSPSTAPRPSWHRCCPLASMRSPCTRSISPPPARARPAAP